MDFNKYKFEVIDISVRGTTDIFININGLTVTKKAIEDMSYPAFIRPLIDVEHKAFAIQTCKQNDERAIKFSKPRGEQDSSISLQFPALYRTIRAVMKEHWRDDKRYRITGMYYSDSKAMVFDLLTAEELEALRPVKKNNSSNINMQPEICDTNVAAV